MNLAFFLCLRSVLDDDDVALIDLMSQADLSKKAKSKYHAETYAVPGNAKFISILSCEDDLLFKITRRRVEMLIPLPLSCLVFDQHYIIYLEEHDAC